jgi:hypothetical protein
MNSPIDWIFLIPPLLDNNRDVRAPRFIWGGKRRYFDTMHFESRPEIIAYAKSVGTSAPENQSPH